MAETRVGSVSMLGRGARSHLSGLKKIGITWGDEHLDFLLDEMAMMKPRQDIVKAVVEEFATSWELRPDDKIKLLEIQRFVMQTIIYIKHHKHAQRLRGMLEEKYQDLQNNYKRRHRYANKFARIEALGVTLQKAVDNAEFEAVVEIAREIAIEEGELRERTETTNRNLNANMNIPVMMADDELQRRVTEVISEKTNGSTGQSGT